ncbi:putative baseplate assembly protein [Marilutibacter maris]|uniref:putative baseplate assembly protein n=1 Tax=Marilutibacter maris TaxID=1605891 RepID=UPI000DA7DC45|nr:putative baseplate assembly protein [Lysobacter maris]
MKPITPPDIDSRDNADLVRQTSRLAQALSGWSPGAGPDAASALIGAFAGMAQQVIARLNQMPNRHFLAYLRMLGLQPRPARAAEVPLTFTASAGAQQVRVPAGTQVRGQRADGSSVTFYTSDALELLPAGGPLLARAISYQPKEANCLDRISFDTSIATGRAAGSYQVFAGEDAVEHAVYLAADEVISIVDATVELSIDFASAADAEAWADLQEAGSVVWEYFSDADEGAAWKPLVPGAGTTDDRTYRCQLFDPQTRPADMAGCTLRSAPAAGHACWVRVRLDTVPLGGVGSIPDWCDAHLTTTVPVLMAEAAPEQVLFNGLAIDTGKDYQPLGPQPALNDCCTVVYAPVPVAADATITLRVTLAASDQALVAGDDPRLAWELGAGDRWCAVMPEFTSDPPPQGSDVADADAPSDATYASVSTLKHDGTARIRLFRAPSDVEQPSLRIRIASGSYGTGVTAATDPANGDAVTGVIDNGCRPPVLAGLAVSAEYTPSVTPVCVVDNGEGGQVLDFSTPLTPFRFRDDDQPAFYLAFGDSLGQASVSLYLEVSPLSGVTRESVNAVKNGSNGFGGEGLADVCWEYPVSAESGVTRWRTLQVEDGTQGFAQSGFLRFIAPSDHLRSAQFGSLPLYWLRARLSAGGYAVSPCAGRVLPNSVAASNARGVHDEVLGSSHQTPGQTFVLAHTPVLENTRLVVREPLAPSADPASGGGELPGKAEPEDGSTQTGTAWMRWQQVGSFAASGPQDRHYTLDHGSGTVTFGDGRNGRVPPAGRNNVVMAHYRSGGGADGNLPAGVINRLVTAVAHVASVDNLVAASGGADGEDNGAVMDWGPKLLRHRGCATARQDYEDLVRQGFPQIAKVRAITPGFDPTASAGSAPSAGHVLIVVVPDDECARPSPQLGLLRQVEGFIRSRMPPAVALGLSGPDWMQVAVTVTVVARGMDRADALGEEVERALERFLHPLSGGFDHAGWELGQMVHDSDLMRLLASLPGVDGVGELSVSRRPLLTRTGAAVGNEVAEDIADRRLDVLLVCSGRHTVTIAGSA